MLIHPSTGTQTLLRKAGDGKAVAIAAMQGDKARRA